MRARVGPLSCVQPERLISFRLGQYLQGAQGQGMGVALQLVWSLEWQQANHVAWSGRKMQPNAMRKQVM